MIRLEALVADKHVALVGNSQAILGSNQGDAIDDHDIVIRMNLGLPSTRIDPFSVGYRTDVWATARHWPNVSVPASVICILWMKLTKLGAHELKQWNRDPPSQPIIQWPKDLEAECRKFVGADPSTGIRLLWWLKDRCAKITPYGMDCWRDVSHWSGQRNTHNHDRDKEWDAMRRLGYA